MLISDSFVHPYLAESPERPWPKLPAFRTAHHLPEYTVETLIGEMDTAGVDRAILVPPSWEGDRNDVAIKGAIDFPGRVAVMGRINLEKPEDFDITTWRDQPGMLGVRLTFFRPNQFDWLTEGVADWFFAAAEQADMPVMVYAPEQTAAMGDVARRYPNLRLILNHLNLDPTLRDEDMSVDIDAAVTLAPLENIALGVSTLPLHVSDPFPFTSLHPYVERIVEAFGADRCMWGSDLSRMPCTYDEWVRAAKDGFTFMSESERDLLMGGALAKWLDWPES